MEQLIRARRFHGPILLLYLDLTTVELLVLRNDSNPIARIY